MKTHILLLILLIAPSIRSNPINQCLEKNTSTPVQQQIQACQQAQQNSPQDLDIILQLGKLLKKDKRYLESNTILSAAKTNPAVIGNNDENLYQLTRTLGINHYLLNDYMHSLSLFKEALSIAQANNNLRHIAMSFNDLGGVYLAQSRYLDAISSYQQSLHLKEQLNLEKQAANTLHNIGNAYLALKDHKNALLNHKRALAIFSSLEEVDPYDIVHIKDQISRSMSELGDQEAAMDYLLKAIEEAREKSDDKAMLFHPLCGLAEMYINNNLLVSAREVLKQVDTIEPESITDEMLRLEIYSKLHIANQDYLSAQDVALLGFSTAQLNDSESEMSLFSKLLSIIYERQGHLIKALEFRKHHISLQEQYLKKKYDAEIKYVQNDIELLQQQKLNQLQNLELKDRNLCLVMLSSLSLLVALSFIFYAYKRSMERKHLLQDIKRHRRKLQKLEDYEPRLTQLFKSVNQPLICFNDFKTVVYANPILQNTLDHQTVIGQNIETIFPNLSDTLDEILTTGDETLEEKYWAKTSIRNELFHLHINSLSFLDNIIVLSFQMDTDHEENIQAFQYIKNANSLHEMVDTTDFFSGQSLTVDIDGTGYDASEKMDNRMQLVELMKLCLSFWRKSTGGTRIDLAEKSRVWRISIDDGRLRVRTLDKYLSIKTLPKSPRWRSVLKTAHFILAECTLNEQDRNTLNQLLENVEARLY